METKKRKRVREDMESEMRVTSRVGFDGKAVEEEEESETEEKEEIEEEVEVMKSEDQPLDEDEEHELWWNNNEESDREYTLVSETEIRRCKRVFRHGDDSSDVSSDYDSDNYALSRWKDA